MVPYFSFSLIAYILVQTTIIMAQASGMSSLTTFVGVDDIACAYSPGWQFATIPNAFSDKVAFAKNLGGQLRIVLPSECTTGHCVYSLEL